MSTIFWFLPFCPLSDYFHETIRAKQTNCSFFFSIFYHYESLLLSVSLSFSLSSFIFISLLHYVRGRFKSFRRPISSQSRSQMPTVLLRECFNECGSSDTRVHVILFPQCFPFLILLPLRFVPTTLIFPFFPFFFLFFLFLRKKGANAHRDKERQRRTRNREERGESATILSAQRLKG